MMGSKVSPNAIGMMPCTDQPKLNVCTDENNLPHLENIGSTGIDGNTLHRIARLMWLFNASSSTSAGT
jgi:hypothetical protein